MKLIAVVGKQGSGKSYFSKLLLRYFSIPFKKNSLCINIDEVGHTSLNDPIVACKLKAKLGKTILDEDGSISRKKLSNLVFSNKVALEILNETTLPKMKEIINDIILKSKNDNDYIILDYALLPAIPSLFEACDYKILIEASIEDRKKRVTRRDDVTEEKFFNREEASLTYDPKDFDIVFQNPYTNTSSNVKIENNAYAVCLHLEELSKKEKIAYYPGSFDPITYGHIDVIKKALKLGFDKIIVAVTANSSKKNTMFSLNERVDMIKKVFDYNSKIEVITVEAGKASVRVAEKYNCCAMIRGLRNMTDFEYELDLSKVNTSLSNVETLFLTASHKYDFVSSSFTRELAYLNEDISAYVPPYVEECVKEKIRANK